MTVINEQKQPPIIEVAIDRKAQRAGEKMLRAQKHQDIYNNYATPLMGTFLNLTASPALIQCPSCGVQELSEVHIEPKRWTHTINNLFGCLFASLCCCCCFNYNDPCRQSDTNHYCKNCSCYFGRAKRVPPARV